MSTVGFYEQEITPRRPVFLAGYADRTAPMTGVQDPIYLRILALGDTAGRRAVIVTADLLGFPDALAWRLKGWVEQEFQIPSAQVIVNAAHTHYAPVLQVPGYGAGWSVDPAYLEEFEQSLRRGVRAALADAREREIRYGFAAVPLGVNRRLTDPRHPGQCEMRANVAGFYDSLVPVLAVYDGGTLVGLFYSCNCHPTSQDINAVSADYPGALSRALKAAFGPAVHTVFAQGTGASAKPRFFDPQTLRFREVGLAELDAFGTAAARPIIDLVRGNGMRRLELALAGREKTFLLPFDRAKYLPQKELLRLATGGTDDLWDRRWAAAVYESNRLGLTPAGYPLQATRLDLNAGLRIIGLSGEVTGEMGALVKGLFPAESTLCLGYCSNVDGYIPTSAMLPDGGYEAAWSGKLWGWPAPFAPELDAIMKREIQAL